MGRGVLFASSVRWIPFGLYKNLPPLYRFVMTSVKKFSQNAKNARKFADN
jgi:hypothetical protein